MKILFTLTLCVMYTLSFSQGREITGVVTDAESNDPLIGVTVLVEDTGTGTVTDFDGRFTVTAETGNTLLISYTGYSPERVVVGTEDNYNVQLSFGSVALEEVVVVGYGTQRTKDLTSSITTIKSEDITKTPSSQAMQALQGKVAGMQIVSSGTPGSGPTVRIRGIGSFPGSGDAAPLYVVDGMFFDNIDFLNNNDIASISVLKDASAAAIYGVRAANGVVLVETKSGSYNQPAEIVYDGYYGIQVAQNVLKLANAEQFTDMALESGSEADISFIQNAMQRYGRSRINPNVPDVNTDWYDQILREAPMQNHSLSISGGGSNATYSIGGSYFLQDGILDMKNEYERFNLRSKVDYKATDWLTIGGNMLLSNSTQYAPAQDAWFRAYFAVPIMPVYDDMNEDAFPVNLANAQDLGYRGGQNPLSSTLFNNNRLKRRNLVANFYLQVDLIPEKLTFKSSYNHNYLSYNARNIDLPYFIGNGYQNPNSSISRTYENRSNQIWDNLLTFTEDFNRHNLQVMAGTSYRDEAWDQLRATGLNFPVDQEEAWYIDQAETIPVDNVGDNGARQYGLSYFGRVAYNYDHKYLLYGTLRADGTSKYQEKWGYFPTVGIGWVASQEDFFNVTGIDYLKFRASWGELGNDNVPASDGARTTDIITTAIDDQLVTGTTSLSVFSYLSWEVVEELNFGLTSYLFDNRLSLDADYYIRDTKNAVIPVENPSIGGTVRKNVGVIRNSGFELALNWTDNFSQDFRYYIGGNISTLKNEVVDLFGQAYVDGGSAEFRQRSIVGQPLLAFFGREVVGVYQNQAQIDADPVAVANNLEPGDLIYRDQNGDGEINDDDRVILGSYLPNLMFGGNFGLGFKGFDLSVSVFGQSGNKILNRKRGEVIFTSDTNMDADLAINRWHGEGTSNSYPSSKGIRKGWNQRLSTYFIEDGSFFRIQNVQVGYNLKGADLGSGMPDIRVYFTAERPLTLFDYNGFNPEVATGIDRQTYPIPAIYTAGLNVRF
ncbi:SusC/RagA family protein [Flavilitoribacter nigricans DSM 23189 = NBRC 102662]|uniref:SusC/RagA family protein n=2 Tax=Flavilitoribacter TaxID=2762562 RepID=A0A2D0NDZ4_FLAN2|nr:SusC/RagA family protein [Flavilitoribacter nigricans DSM 23189 = NBRC 102662]